MRIAKSMRLNLSCYCCGGIDFEVKKLPWNEVENMFFVQDKDNPVLKCSKCGLEDYLRNLVPRGFLHEELSDN